jgi:integrase
MARTKATRIEQRDNGIFYIKTPGNRTGHSTGTRDRGGAAEAALVAFLQRREAELLKGDTLLTSTALDHYLSEHVDNGEKGVVGREAARTAARFLKQHFGDISVSHIGPGDVEGYVKARRTGKIHGTMRSGKPYRPAGNGTLRRELGVLIAAINHETKARDQGALKARLSKAEVPHIQLPPEPPPRDRWLSDEERLTLLRVTAPEAGERLSRIHRFLWLALETAARKRSIETLTWLQVDLERRVINYNPAGRRQTKKRRAIVPISDELLPVLQRAKAEMQKDSGDVAGYVLDHPRTVRWSFDAAVKAAKLPGVTPHTLRHTWATRAAQNRVSMWDIAGVLGDDVDTVTKRYAHHSPDYLRSAVNFRQPAPAEGKKEQDDG